MQVLLNSNAASPSLRRGAHRPNAFLGAGTNAVSRPGRLTPLGVAASLPTIATHLPPFAQDLPHGAWGSLPGTPPARKRRTRVGPCAPNHGTLKIFYGIQATETDTRKRALATETSSAGPKTTRPGRTHATDRFASAARSPTVPQRESKPLVRRSTRTTAKPRCS